MKLSSISEGGVYRRGEHWRRVIGFVDRGDQRHVIYSIGGDSNRRCQLNTFARWARTRVTQDMTGQLVDATA